MTPQDLDGLLQAGDALLGARKYEQALHMASQALAADPTSGPALLLASQCLMNLGRFDEATVAARQAVAADPDWAQAYRILSLALRRAPGTHERGVLDSSVDAARQAVRLEPNNAASYVVLAEACAVAKQLKDADTAVRQAIELAPNRATTWVSASFVAIRAGNWAAAEGAARRALRLDPDNAAAGNNLGVAIRRQGRWAIGAVAFFDAARIDPHSPTARENVESIGFLYLSTLSAIPLLPLLIFWPLFFAARVGVARWLATKPTSLRPLARRLGIRVATSKRFRRRFEKENLRIEEQLRSTGPTSNWSALEGRQRLSRSFIVVVGLATIGAGLIMVAAIFSASNSASVTGLAVAAVVFGAGGGVIVRVGIRRTRRVY